MHGKISWSFRRDRAFDLGFAFFSPLIFWGFYSRVERELEAYSEIMTDCARYLLFFCFHSSVLMNFMIPGSSSNLVSCLHSNFVFASMAEANLSVGEIV